MIVKLKKTYESEDVGLIEVVKSFFELIEYTDVKNKQQVEILDRIANKLGDVYERVIDSNHVVVPAITTRDTVALYELDYLRNSSAYYVIEAICENDDGIISHFSIDTLHNL